MDMLYNYKAQIVRVIDGDTVDAIIDMGLYMSSTHRLRLLGVDTPELKGMTLQAGRDAKDFVTRELLGRAVVIHTEKSDSFGRWLAHVYIDGESFNLRLVAEGYAVPFMV